MAKRLSPSEEKAVLASLSQQTAAWLIGRTPRSLRDSDAPREPSGSYDARAVVAWFLAQEATNADPMLGDGDSPALERYRAARAGLAEIDLAQRQKEFVPVAQIRPALLWVAMHMRRVGERLQNMFGPEALKVMNGGIAEMCALIDREFPFPATDDNRNDQKEP